MKQSEYPRLTLRLPPDTFDALYAWRTVVRRPIWRLVDEAVGLTIADLPADVKRRVDTVRRARRQRPEDLE